MPSASTRSLRAQRLSTVALGVLIVLGPSPVLAEGGRASGEVVDESGKPASGIRLRLMAETGEPAASAPIEVTKGRFVIASFPPGPNRLEVEGDAWSIKRFEIEIRGGGGEHLGDMQADVPAGAKAPSFQVRPSQRAFLKLVIGPAAVAGLKSASAIREARATSATLQKLNELLDSGDMNALLVESEKVLASHPDLGGALYLKGVALWKTGRVEEAVSVIRRATEIVPDQPGIHGVLGVVLLDLSTARKEAGKETEAKQVASDAADAFGKEIETSPNDVNSLTNRVIALEGAGRTPEAVDAIRALLAADPQNTKAYYRIADLLMGAGRNEEAVEWLDKLPTKDAKTAQFLYNVAVNFYNRGTMQLAADTVRKAIAIAPEEPHAHDLLGRALLALGDVAGAVREFKEFVRLAPDDPEAESTRKQIKEME